MHFLSSVLVGLLLLTLMHEMRAIRFVLQTDANTGLSYAHVYHEERHFAKQLPILFDGEAQGNQSALFLTNGERLYLSAFLVAQPETIHNPFAAGLSLSLNPTNGLWIRYRYAEWMNQSLLLSNDRSETILSSPPSFALHWQCLSNPGSDSFCDAGLYTELHHNVTYNISIRPSQPRGALPPSLFFYLSTAKDGTCLDFLGPNGTSPLRICTQDLVWFALGLQPTDVIIGGRFWRSNYSLVTMDGITGQLITVLAINESRIWIAQLLASIAASLTLIFTYGRWATGMQTLSLGLYMWHILRSDKRNEWQADVRFGIGTFLLILSAVTCTLLSWLGMPYEPVSSGIGPNFMALAIVLTVVGWIQFALAMGLFITTDACDGGWAQSRWATDHCVPIWIAWARHQAHAAAAITFASLGLLPLAWSGIVWDSRLLVIALLSPLFTLLYHQTYYTLAAISLAFQGDEALSQKRFRAFAIFQLLLLILVAATMSYFFFGPLLDLSSAYFDSTFNFLGAALLLTVIIVLAAYVLLWEATLMLRQFVDLSTRKKVD